ncbi:MAG: hypothetical protein M3N50_02225 [Pseudomonadota bacterium]|nr:hypothetical protein [Pseudomonadota bacterium]
MTRHAENLADSASDTFEDLKRAARPAMEAGTRQAGALLDQGGELIDTIRSHAGDTVTTLQKRIVAYTKDHPLTALLLAVGVGAALLSAAKSMHSRR